MLQEYWLTCLAQPRPRRTAAAKHFAFDPDSLHHFKGLPDSLARTSHLSIVGRSFMGARFRRFTAEPSPAECREGGFGGGGVSGGGGEGGAAAAGAKVLKSLSQGANEMEGGGVRGSGDGLRLEIRVLPE
jgi:hypothetical protein